MSETDDPYRAPQSNVSDTSSERVGGSIENTLGGYAELDIGDVFSEAWEKISGIKGYVIGGGILIYIIGMPIVLGILSVLFGVGQETIFGGLVIQLVIIMMIYPFMAGVFMLGLRQSVGRPVGFNQLFSQYGMVLPILGIVIIQSIATSIGFLLLILPGIYVAIALGLAIPLKVEKQLGVVECLTTSMQLVNKKFLNVAVLAIVSSLVATLSFITIIGWIWGIPWMLMVFAITYRQLAGVNVATLEAGEPDY